MDRTDAQTRRETCSAHVIDATENYWCQACDTGECPDCHQPTFYGSDNDYHHIDPIAPPCFLVRV